VGGTEACVENWTEEKKRKRGEKEKKKIKAVSGY
jgi:hypothetical protein